MTTNVIFISIDALRKDRLSAYGYGRPTSPTLEKLTESAFVCNNHFAINASTMGAFPTIMNSSRPLSYGGFDNGVFTRPPSVFRQMHNAGAQTYMMSTVHWVNRFFGYGDGVDEEEMLFSLGAMIGTTGALTRTSLERYNDGEFTLEDLLNMITPVINASFDRLEQFAEERISRHHRDKKHFRRAPFYADGFDYQRVLQTVASHRQKFHMDPSGYIETYIPKPFRATGWMSPVWRRQREPWRLIEEISEKIRTHILTISAPSEAFLRRQRYKRYPDAEMLVDHILDTVTTRPSEKPFFLWTHFFDTHLPYCAGAQPNWHKKTAGHLEALGYDPQIDPGLTFGSAPTTEQEWAHWGALYDAAVHFVDGAIARLIAGLKQAGLYENTTLMFCGDHGEELGENNDISHHFRLYGYNTHVPLIISGNGVNPGETNALTTHLDIAPTITDVSGGKAHSDWEGLSVFDKHVDNRQHVLMETFYGSPCDFENRPLYFGVRDLEFHMMWKEHRDSTDHLSPDGNQLYDVVNDPLQKTNIYNDAHPAVLHGKRVIADRMREMPEVSEDRIIKAFGSNSKRI